MEINAAGFGSVGHGHVLWLKELIFFAGKMEVIWLILLQIVLELAGEIQKPEGEEYCISCSLKVS